MFFQCPHMEIEIVFQGPFPKSSLGQKHTTIKFEFYTIKEGVMKEKELTADETLLSGQNVTRRRSLSAQYVMYSGVEIPDMGRITNKEVILVYRKELMKISRIGEFMGIWQFHQACEVLKSGWFHLSIGYKSKYQK